jgi:hypothetical protein
MNGGNATGRSSFAASGAAACAQSSAARHVAASKPIRIDHEHPNG